MLLTQSTRVNLSNSRLESRDQDNPIEQKSRQIMKLNSQLTQCWKMQLKKNQLKKQKKNQVESTRVNLPNPQPGSCGWDNSIKNKSKQIMKLKFQ